MPGTEACLRQWLSQGKSLEDWLIDHAEEHHPEAAAIARICFHETANMVGEAMREPGVASGLVVGVWEDVEHRMRFWAAGQKMPK